MNRLCVAAWIAVLALGVAGCGGGSGSGGPDGPKTGSTANGKPTGRGAVVVTVRDVLGSPVAGADVRIGTCWTDEDRRGVADATGRVEFQEIIASKISVTAYGKNSYGGVSEKTVSEGGVLQLTVVAEPIADSTGGVVAARVTNGGLSDDGRTLEFSLQLVQVSIGPDWVALPEAVRIDPCTPDGIDVTSDLPVLHVDCVTGSGGYNAAYSGLQDGAALAVKRIEAQGPYALVASPYAAVLLLDQSSSVIVDDPGDERLFAAKYFLRFATGHGYSGSMILALAAFAADDPVSGARSLLPLHPVTVFPADRPGWAHEAGGLDASVDSLARLEGGRKPLFAAIDRMLDFAAASPSASKRAVVVVTDGRDDTCGTPAQCQEARDAVVRKSRASGVAIVTVGLQNSAGRADRETLALLSQGTTHGGAFWADRPTQLAPILGKLNPYFADLTDTLEATFRIEASAPGTFVPGRIVHGRVRLEVCPFGCTYTYVPFAVRIPPPSGP